MKTKLPNKIFNLAVLQIPFNTVIYTTKYNSEYRLIEGKTKRASDLSILFTIPNNKAIKVPYIKSLQKNEVDSLWKILNQNNLLTTSDFRGRFPQLYQKAPCSFSAFFGIIKNLFPDTFNKTHGKISFNIIKKKQK
jgi:hypothetical protein